MFSRKGNVESSLYFYRFSGSSFENIRNAFARGREEEGRTMIEKVSVQIDRKSEGSSNGN